MKKLISASVAMLFLAWGSPAHAGSPSEKFTTEEMLQRLKSERPGSWDMLELGTRKDPRILPELRARARALSGPPQPVSVVIAGKTVTRVCESQTCLLARKWAARKAKAAAARQGAKEYFDEFVQGLSSADGEEKLFCINVLRYVGDRAAIKSLAPLLDDNGMPWPATPDDQPPRYSDAAMAVIASLMPREELEKLQAAPPGSDEALVMRRWWLKNRANYGRLEFGQEKSFAEPK